MEIGGFAQGSSWYRLCREGQDMPFGGEGEIGGHGDLERERKRKIGWASEDEREREEKEREGGREGGREREREIKDAKLLLHSIYKVRI